MKGSLQTIFLLLFSFAAFAQTETDLLYKPVSVNLRSATVEDVLKDLREEYNLNFFYSSNLSCLNKPVDYAARKKTLQEVLTELFTCAPTRFEVIKDKILIIEEEFATDSAEVVEALPVNAHLDTLSRAAAPSSTKEDTLNSKRFSLSFLFPSPSARSSSGISYKVDTVVTYAKGDSVVIDTVLVTRSVVAKSDLVPKAYREHLFRTRKEKLSIGIFSGAGFSFRSLKENSAGGREMVSARNRVEQKNISFNAGLHLQYSLSDLLVFTTGLSYLSVGERAFSADNSGHVQASYFNRYDYLLIPVGVGIKKKFSNISIGFVSELALGALVRSSVNTPNFSPENVSSYNKRDSYYGDGYYGYYGDGYGDGSYDGYNNYNGGYYGGYYDYDGYGDDYNNDDWNGDGSWGDNNWDSDGDENPDGGSDGDGSANDDTGTGSEGDGLTGSEGGSDSGSGNPTNDITEKETVSTNNLRNYVLILSLQPVIDYSVSSRTTLFFAPDVKIFLTSIYDNTSTFNQKPYSFGMRFGLRYRLW